ncbi:MAG TPA: Slp family lipoprotein [Nitrospira sp.]|nr:Slp family lipoprotein [Nitrospira sp.]
MTSGLRLALVLLLAAVAVGCSPIPRKYLREAVPGTRLSQLVAAPQVYRGKLIILGAAIHEELTRDGSLWLHVRNRPLDQDYRPQLPPSADDPEAGSYWIVVTDPRQFPSSYRHWADMTVVGRPVGLAPGKEPIIRMVYVRGWGLNARHNGVWEDSLDANYLFATPTGAIGEGGQSPP